MLSPLDIEMKEFKKNLGGYNKEDVDEFMRILLQDYKELYMENVSIKDKLGTLTTAVSRYKSMEDVMQNTLIVAQSTSDEVKKVANTKAQTIIEEAEAKAREILMDSKHQLSQINMELSQMKMVIANYKNQMKSILSAGLDIIEKIPDGESVPENQPQAPQKMQEPQPQTYQASDSYASQQPQAPQPEEQPSYAAANYGMGNTEEDRLRREETMMHIRQAMETQMGPGDQTIK